MDKLCILTAFWDFLILHKEFLPESLDPNALFSVDMPDCRRWSPRTWEAAVFGTTSCYIPSWRFQEYVAIIRLYSHSVGSTATGR